MITQLITDDEDGNDNGVLDLSVKKRLPVLLSPPSSTTSSSSSSSSSSVISTNYIIQNGKRMLDLTSTKTKIQQTNKRPLRFQCKHCDYKAPSTSLMQNHIYRHTDLTPYACAYCGHKSTTKSTIMVHIELCHPHMEVKIHENRVREQDFYRDLNSSEITAISNSNIIPPPPPTPTSTTQEPQVKKARRSNQYDSESAPINGVAISLKTMDDDGNESSRASDDTSETENLEPILFDDDEQQIDTNIFDTPPTMAKPQLKLKFSSQHIPVVESSTSITKESDSDGKNLSIIFFLI
jgi:DNA-directed RNA polymerase subunit M/transcription elongation factor TFIIS